MTINSTTNQQEVINIPVDQGLLNLRSLSPIRLRFELEYSLERGSSTNSFLFPAGKNSNGDHHPAVLVHPPGAALSKIFLPALSKALPTGTNELMVVVGHVNPNKVALLKQLAKIYSQLIIVSSNPGTKLLQEIWNQQKPLPNGTHKHSHQEIQKLPKIYSIRKEKRVGDLNQKSHAT